MIPSNYLATQWKYDHDIWKLFSFIIMYIAHLCKYKQIIIPVNTVFNFKNWHKTKLFSLFRVYFIFNWSFCGLSIKIIQNHRQSIQSSVNYLIQCYIIPKWKPPVRQVWETIEKEYLMKHGLHNKKLLFFIWECMNFKMQYQINYILRVRPVVMFGITIRYICCWWSNLSPVVNYELLMKS